MRQAMRPAPAAAARSATPRHRPVARCCVSRTESGTIAPIARRRPCTATPRGRCTMMRPARGRARGP
eukprot:5992328-Prymnesium_polylepis.1